MKITTMAFPWNIRARQLDLKLLFSVCCLNYVGVFPTYTEPWRN